MTAQHNQYPSLPTTLSKTLSLAINDARQLDRTIYHPNYHFWHGSNIPSKHLCKLCLAGALMAQTLNTAVHMFASPGCFGPVTRRRLNAINDCRTGHFRNAYIIFHRSRPSLESQDRLKSLPIPEAYDFIGWTQFNAHLRSLEAIIPLLSRIEIESLQG